MSTNFFLRGLGLEARSLLSLDEGPVNDQHSVLTARTKEKRQQRAERILEENKALSAVNVDEHSPTRVEFRDSVDVLFFKKEDRVKRLMSSSGTANRRTIGRWLCCCGSRA